MVKTHQDEITAHHSPKDKPHSSIRDQVADEPSARNLPRPDSQKRSEDVASAAGDQPAPDNNKGSEEAAPVAKDHHKRSEDALAAAKERFLARKKAKTQTTL